MARDDRGQYKTPDGKQASVIDNAVLVFGQMNEPPGARLRVALSGLTMAEYFRDEKGQDVLLFVDNIFRFVQAGSEVSALLGRMPSAVGYQPTMASEMGALQERITSTKKGSVTSMQAIYVPADDITDPAPVATFAHLDSTIILDRAIAELGIYPAVDPLKSTSRMLDPQRRRRGALQRRARGAADPAALRRPEGHHRDPRHRGALRRGQAASSRARAASSASCRSRSSSPSSSPARPACSCRARTRCAPSRRSSRASTTTCPSRPSTWSASTSSAARGQGQAREKAERRMAGEPDPARHHARARSCSTRRVESRARAGRRRLDRHPAAARADGRGARRRGSLHYRASGGARRRCSSPAASPRCATTRVRVVTRGRRAARARSTRSAPRGRGSARASACASARGVARRGPRRPARRGRAARAPWRGCRRARHALSMRRRARDARDWRRTHTCGELRARARRRRRSRSTAGSTRGATTAASTSSTCATATA